MRSLEKLLEAERAAGLCDLDATPSGNAMHDRVWARTQASIAAEAAAGDTPLQRATVWTLIGTRRTIWLAALLFAVSPLEGQRSGEPNDAAPTAPAGGASRSDATAAAVTPSYRLGEAGQHLASGASAVPIDALPTASTRSDPMPSAPGSGRRTIASKRAPAATPRVSPSASANEIDQLDVERRLLDRVRHALAARDYAGAGTALRTYERTFPAGQLVEEAQALEIRWLAASGDAEAARSQANRFRERFPTSFFRPAVETALRGAKQGGGAP